LIQPPAPTIGAASSAGQQQFLPGDKSGLNRQIAHGTVSDETLKCILAEEIKNF